MVVFHINQNEKKRKMKPDSSPKLGLRLSHDRIKDARLCSIRVLDVFPDSPASEAGLESFEDYLLGTDEVVFRNFAAFASVFPEDDDGSEKKKTAEDDVKEKKTVAEEKRNEEALTIFVFHHRTAKLRVVRLFPNPKWGGNGSLGCDVGYGTAHQMPVLSYCTLDLHGK
eukprot:TRINITY_DN5546_c0_g1_i2.p1 TRINITY_DN5546_c0_g1~~TRINITY_DN5546_c0_g1_i2.p1  ORF type:complete len:169 (+),score=51.85 TRINITY_DN5546_c0_g1_i2:465-971(+)